MCQADDIRIYHTAFCLSRPVRRVSEASPSLQLQLNDLQATQIPARLNLQTLARGGHLEGWNHPRPRLSVSCRARLCGTRTRRRQAAAWLRCGRMEETMRRNTPGLSHSPWLAVRAYRSRAQHDEAGDVRNLAGLHVAQVGRDCWQCSTLLRPLRCRLLTFGWRADDHDVPGMCWQLVGGGCDLVLRRVCHWPFIPPIKEEGASGLALDPPDG